MFAIGDFFFVNCFGLSNIYASINSNVDWEMILSLFSFEFDKLMNSSKTNCVNRENHEWNVNPSYVILFTIFFLSLLNTT